MDKATHAATRRTCPECGKKFTPKRKHQRYCTGPRDGPGSCQKKAERKRAKARGYKKPRIKMVCHHCECEFMGEKKQRRPGSHENYYCSHECYANHRRFAYRKQFATDLTWKECSDCSVSFIAKKRRVRCDSCINKERKPRYVAGPCAECGEGFVGNWHSVWPSRYCCDECQERASRRRQKKKVGHCSTHRQRARKLGVAYEWVNRKKVFQRDEYVCGICGLRTEPNSKPCSPRYPTIDHILPMALGGGHTYTNVQCACFECNWMKGDQAPDSPIQMQLGLYMVIQK